jgi:hypothetical protein
MDTNGHWSKTCRTCGQVGSKSDFYSDRSRPDSLSSQCRECHKARMRVYWQSYYPTHRVALIAAAMERKSKHAA